MARLHAKSSKIVGIDVVSIESNFTDVPEGTKFYRIAAYNIGYGQPIQIHLVDKQVINQLLRDLDRPLCDDVDPLAEKKADLITKEQKANDLKPVADAAAFAIDQSNGDSDEVSQELRTHWSAQEHAYLVAQSEVETLKRRCISAL